MRAASGVEADRLRAAGAPVAATERLVKGALFDCKMCGQCVLSSTGMSCPMNCPKNLRNGPCGGVRDNGNCEVRPEMKCVWLEAVAGARAFPVALKSCARSNRRLTAGWSAILVAAGGAAARRRAGMNFEDEPVPGYPLPILPGHTSPGRLERVLRAGQFAVTSELAPPDSADPEEVYQRARMFDRYVDAINATDGSGANCHMSSLAVCALLTRVGYAPVMQISCRDRNRIAIQGDILGGAAMGVCNVLCLSGDGVQAGDHPQALPVFDLDSMSLLRPRARCVMSTGSSAAARSPTRPACCWARRRIRSPTPLHGVPNGSQRRSRPARSSSRRSIAMTSRC